MQQGKHTEYEKNLHDELSMSSTTTVHGGPHPGGSSGVGPGVSNSVPGGSDGGPSASMITAGSATYSSPSAVGAGSNQAPGTSSGSSMSTSSTVASVVANSTAVGSSTGTTPNGRAASEHSDKIPSSTSRTPSPHHSHMANGGWPNLGMDNNSRSRYEKQQPKFYVCRLDRLAIDFIPRKGRISIKTDFRVSSENVASICMRQYFKANLHSIPKHL